MGEDRDAFSEVFTIPPPVVPNRFTWSELPRNRGCELKFNHEVAGTLRRPSCWSSDFVVNSPSGNWNFRRCGFWGTGTEVVDTASQQQIATFSSGWGGKGDLTFTDGQRFHFECKGVWHPVWTVTRVDGRTVFKLHTRESYVDVPNASAVPDSRLKLLVLFALYRVRQAQEDAASAAVVAVIAAS